MLLVNEVLRMELSSDTMGILIKGDIREFGEFLSFLAHVQRESM